MSLTPTERRARQKILLRARKDRLKAEGRCIDCKESSPGRVRCLRCRMLYAERHKRKNCAAGKTEPVFLRNARILCDELAGDIGLDPILRQRMIAEIDKWKAEAMQGGRHD